MVGCETNVNVASLLGLKFVNFKTTVYIPLFKLKCLYSTRCSIKPNMSSFRGWHGASQMAQSVKNLPAVQETWVQSLGWEDPLEEGTATHFSILAWRIPWTQEPNGWQFIGSQRIGQNWACTHALRVGCAHKSISFLGNQFSWRNDILLVLN